MKPTFLFIPLSLARLVLGAPEPYNGPRSAPSQGCLTMTQDCLNNFKFYAQYSLVALCNTGAKPGAAVKCKGACPAVENNKVTVVGSFSGSIWNLNGLVALDHVRREIVGVIRATTTVRNVIADAVIIPKDCDLVSGCKVHTGFADAWQDVASTFKALLDDARKRQPSYRVTFTGYSLGGSTALLAAAYLRGQGYDGVDVYTFGAPRVGNDAFIDYVMRQNGSEYRITHWDDLAPTYVPLFLGYRHNFPEYWLSQGPSTRIHYEVQDVQVCMGPDQKQCNEAQFNLDIVAHLFYFQSALVCFPIGLRKRMDTSPKMFLDKYVGVDVLGKLKTWHQKDLAIMNNMGKPSVS